MGEIMKYFVSVVIPNTIAYTAIFLFFTGLVWVWYFSLWKKISYITLTRTIVLKIYRTIKKTILFIIRSIYKVLEVYIVSSLKLCLYSFYWIFKPKESFGLIVKDVYDFFKRIFIKKLKEPYKSIQNLWSDILKIFSINKLYIDHPETRIYIRMLSSRCSEDVSMIQYKFALPLWLPFKKVKTDHIEQSIKQAFQRYFTDTRDIKIIYNNNQFTIEGRRGKKQILNQQQIVDIITGGKPMHFTLWVDENNMVIDRSFLWTTKTSNPHWLITWTTWSWKSVCMRLIMNQLIAWLWPKELNLYICDPKGVEFMNFERVPHTKKMVLSDYLWMLDLIIELDDEMEERYKEFRKARVNSIEKYNKHKKEIMPYIVIVIDEIINLVNRMNSEGKDKLKQLRNSIENIAVKWRASWIHLLMWSQKLLADTLTSETKSNMGKIAFQSANNTDSLNAIWLIGAEHLGGKGEWVVVLKDSWENTLLKFQWFFLEDDVEEMFFKKVVDVYSNGWVKEKKEKVITENKDKFDILLNKILSEWCFKTSWHKDIDWFTQKNIRTISKVLQNQWILKKQKDNSLKLSVQEMPKDIKEIIKKSL